MALYKLNFGEDIKELYFRAVKKSFSINGENFSITLLKNRIDEKIYYTIEDRGGNAIISGEKITPNANLLKEISYRYNFGIIALPEVEIAVMQDVSFSSISMGDYTIYWGDIDSIKKLEV